MSKFDEKLLKNSKPSPLFGIINFIFFFFLIILIVGGAIAYYNYRTYVSFIEFKTKKSDKTILIPAGAGAYQATEILAKEGIIPDSKIFGVETYKIYFYLNETPPINLASGKHIIKEGLGLIDLLKSFEPTQCTTANVTLIEGQRTEEFADVLAKKLKDFSAEKFINYARNFDAENLELAFKIPKNLEGFLFPDTYTFCEDIDEKEVVKKLVQNFNRKYISELKNLQEKETDYSLTDIIIIASMLEREAKLYSDKQKIADLIKRRLSEKIPLGIDATTQYEFGYSAEQKTWWRIGKELNQVIDTNHEYSTRKNLGLPPTPISNPGVESIKAVYNSIPNKYYFYVSDESENIYYSENLQQHNVNVCKYVTKTCL